MNLIIDIGNTRAKLLVFDGTEIIDKAYCDSKTLCALDELTKKYPLEKGMLSTVAKLGEEAEMRLKRLPFSMQRLSAQTPLPEIRFRRPGSHEVTPLPSTMGADRIAAICGAIALLPDSPLLIIDSGSCITYEVIDNKGYYLGGNIAPGLQQRLIVMHEHTALLPLVEKEGDVPVIGYDTETCMRSGVIMGIQYEMEGYIRHWREVYPTLQVILTGGDKWTLDKTLASIIHYDDTLVPRALNTMLLNEI